MAFIIDDAFLPATLTAAPMTDEEFAEFCGEYPDLFFETTAEGEIIVMAPVFTLTGFCNAHIGSQLSGWADRDGRGVVSNSSGCFVLPNGARRAADAAWVERESVAKLRPEEFKLFWHLCPKFVIELRSHGDRLPVLRAKMQEWMDNGAQLGWLIDLEKQTVEVYRPGREPELVSEAESIQGEGLVSEFVLELGSIWDPLG